MATAIKHPVPDRIKPSFAVFDILSFSRSALSVRVAPGFHKLGSKGRLTPIWHRMHYRCSRMATASWVKGLTSVW